MIDVKGLTVYYKNKDSEVMAVKNIDLHIKRGEICTVIGPSGGGKSTLLNVMAGIIKDYKGEVLINNEHINPKIHKIGFIPQNYGLINWKTVEKNILLSSKIKYGKSNIDLELYKEIIKKLNISHCVRKYPNQLSGGEKQRVAIARGLLLKPNLLLMDESFSALDAMTREEVQKLFLDIWKEHRVTTILVTHDIREAIYLGSRIIIMSSTPGRILKIMENPLFSKKYTDFGRKYEELDKNVRKFLKGDKKYEVK